MTAPAITPYVAAFSDEILQLGLTFVEDARAASGWRLSYTDPVDGDWDLSVLWARQAAHRTHRGRIQYDQIHTLRQKRCMQQRLCQVCESPALEEGRLRWIFHQPVPAAGQLSKPPICARCIPDALDACPSLRREAHLYTSPDYELWGVNGLVFVPGMEMPTRHHVPFSGVGTLEFTLARALTVRVRDLRNAPAP